MGGLFYAKSAAFLEDIPLEENHDESFGAAIDTAYKKAATNCFGAVGLYAGCLVFCGIQVVFNLRLAAQKQQ
jgi:hypothetical protein